MTQQRPEPSGDLTAMEIAEAVWLASVISRQGGALDGPPDSRARSTDVRPDSPESRPSPPADHVPPPSDAKGEARLPDGSAPAVGGPGRLDAESDTPRQPRSAAHSTKDAPALGGRPRPRTLPALSDPLALARALRPLRNHAAVSRNRLFDEAATARRAAEDDFWLPVFRRTRSRPWDEATLIVDDSPTMRMWTRTGAEFAELLARIDAFATVRTLRLDTTTGTDGRLPVLRNRSDEVSPRSLGGPGRRGVVLVLTDGVGAAWRTGTAPALLRDLARTHTTAVVHLLPERAWPFSGITARSVPLRLAAPGPGNTGLLVSGRQDDDILDELAFDEEGRDTERLPQPLVPVLGLRPGFLGQWSRLAAGRRTSEPLKLPVMLDADSTSDEPGAAARPAAPSAEHTVRRTRSRLSRTAFDGAVRLAALPLSEAVVHQLPLLLDPGFELEHLGELLASKLLLMEPTGAGGGFAFDPGVREALLAYGNRADTFHALQSALPIVGDGVQHEFLEYQLRVFRGEDATPPAVTEANRAHVTLSTTVLRAVSGPPAVTGLRPVPDASEVPQPAPEEVVATAKAVTLSASAPPAGVRSYRPSSIWYGVPPRNVHFSGRVRELKTLEERLMPDGPMTAVDALLGMGGIGKSQLAIEYVYRHSHAYDVVCWIPAGQPSLVTAAFQQIAPLLGLRLSSETPVNEAVPAVLEALRAGDLWQRWLLVFDNAEAVEDVEPFFPLGGPGRVLVTSRHAQWAHAARVMRVDVFSRQESRQLLLRRNEHMSPDQADLVADTLGDLPLALEQASVWMLETGMPVGEYLRLFQEKQDELLSVDPPRHYDLPVAAAWNIALARLPS
ncbi:SAV_2336 N-terminal domain-related protein [Streptomyces sp. NPDC003832]